MPNVSIRHTVTGAVQSVNDRIVPKFLGNGWELNTAPEPAAVPEPPAEPVKPGRDTAPSTPTKE